MLMERHLPARLIELQHLYEKFGDAEQKLMPMLQVNIHFIKKKKLGLPIKEVDF